MKLRDEIKWNRSGKSPGWLWDPRHGTILGLNETGAFLLERLLAGVSERDLVLEVSARWSVEPPSAHDDLRTFRAILEEHDLVAR